MLPLDKFNEEVKAGFAKHDVKEEDILIALELDLNEKGDFGNTWLAIDREHMKLYAISITSDADTVNRQKQQMLREENRKKKNPDKQQPILGLYDNAVFVSYDLKELDNPYVDNFMSSNRLLAKKGMQKLSEEALAKDIFHENKNGLDPATGETVVIAYSTNAKKRKLFAFIDIWKRIKRDDVPKEDDPIFEQFHHRCPKCGKVYADQNRQICDVCSQRGAVLKRLLVYFKDFKVQLFTVLFCMLATSGISLISPIVNGKILYDYVIDENGRWHSAGLISVVTVVLVIFGMALLNQILNIIQNRANAHLSTRVTLNMKLDIFSSMQKLSLSFFNNNQTGRLITRVNYDADRIRSFFIDGVPHLIINGLNFIGLTIFLFIMNWQLTLIVFIPVPLIVLIFKFMLPKLWRMYTKQYRRSSSLNALLGDALTGIRVVKAFAKEDVETNRFHTYSEKLYEANLQLNMVSLTIFPLIGLLIALSSKAIWGFGGIQVMHGVMSYGEFATYFGYLGMIFGPLNFFTNFTNMVTDTMNSAQRMFEIIDAVPEISDAPDAIDIPRLKGKIELNKVCFHYTANRPILKDVSLIIHPGDHVGLVGHTGAGKSTIANLINRLYDVISGSIMLDDVNVKQLTSKTLRRNIAIVSQEIFLFKGTIADNIRYARPDATMDEVIAASRVANAHDFIMSLPDGYETVVGTGSRSLSGGEQQRVSIARALLLDPTILILDEATAAMDTETERQIQEALNKLVTGRTTITIAHRLSTLKECNYLYAIENGEIAEEGTHTELIAKKGVYFRLYTLQSEAMKKVLQGM